MNSDLNSVSENEKTHFKQLQTFSKLELDQAFKTKLEEAFELQKGDRVRAIFPSVLWKAAAIFCVGIGSYYLWLPSTVTTAEPLAAIEDDPEKAFEITKQALLLVSTKLNKASELNTGLDKFDEAQSKIKRKNK